MQHTETCTLLILRTHDPGEPAAGLQDPLPSLLRRGSPSERIAQRLRCDLPPVGCDDCGRLLAALQDVFGKDVPLRAPPPHAPLSQVRIQIEACFSRVPPPPLPRQSSPRWEEGLSGLEEGGGGVPAISSRANVYLWLIPGSSLPRLSGHPTTNQAQALQSWGR